MATKRKLIERAAAGFGITSAFDLSPEEMQEGLDLLNALAAEWDGVGIRVGYSFGAGLDEEAGIPDTSENAFATNLSVRWAGNFGKEPSQTAKVAARTSWNALYAARGVMPQVPLSSRLPVGRGNRRGTLERQYFPESTEVPGLNDGATEY